MKPLYIFDLDGTICCCKHRRHFVERERSAQDWKGFYAACDLDAPLLPVVSTMERLRHAGADIWFFSGRSDEVREAMGLQPGLCVLGPVGAFAVDRDTMHKSTIRGEVIEAFGMAMHNSAR